MFFIPKLKIQPKTTDWADVALVTDEKIIKRVDRLLVRPICRAGMWGWFHNLLPLAGGTAQAHATSLTHPGTRDVTWSGTITHNSDGVQGDGVTGYGVMPPLMSVADNTDFSLGGYCLTAWGDLAHATTETLMGVSVNLVGRHTIAHKLTASAYRTYHYGRFQTFVASSGVIAQTSANDIRGLIHGGGQAYCYRNGATWGSDEGGLKNGINLGSTSMGLLCQIADGNPIQFYSGKVALFFSAQGFTLQQHQTLYDIVQKYQVAMGRAYVA